VSLVLTNSLGAAGWPATPRLGLHNLIGGGIVAFSAAMAWAAHRDRLSPSRLLGVGLGYEVLVAAGISLQDNLGSVAQARPLYDLSWLAILIVLFPLVVPAPPAKVLAASLLAASMWPLAFLVGIRWLGNPVPIPSVVVLNFLENYIAAALALVPTMILGKLAADVQKARQMGSYQLVELLAQGGMGEVWRARHNMLARPAAIKLVRGHTLGLGAGGPDESLLRRFEREAQATAALHSPHTVELYDFGVTAGGTFYYVMEILDGLDLEQLVRRFGPLPPERAVHLLVQLCDSLADAHAVGLVHRDVKPANVYACRKGLKYDFVKLLDFGLVKPAWREEVGDSSLTQEGAVPGTPAYLAPEVALGSLEVDGRADLYAAGCVAYWLLTGQRVFEAKSAVQMAIQHAQTIPVPPSQRAGRPVPPALEEVVLSCLEKDPSRRPPTAEELARRLSQCGLERTWSQEDARAWWQAHLAAGNGA
jgi:eukaryotic-like serine/threonine-protein kinase